MTKKIIGTTKLTELSVGRFASINGNIVYKYKQFDSNTNYWFPPGVLLVEKHGHLVMLDAYRGYGTGKSVDEYGYFCDPIEHPNKKHCDNVIAMARKMMKENTLDGLSYVDILYTMKHYIKEYQERKANG